MRYHFIILGSCAVLGIGLLIPHPAQQAAPDIAQKESDPHAPRRPPLTVQEMPSRSIQRESPTVTMASRAHLLAVPVAAPNTARRASHAGLERALDEDEPNQAWTDAVLEEVRDTLSVDPDVHVDQVRCTQTFCRVSMTKPLDSDLDWPEIDRLLAPVARGETIFSAVPDGALTTGFIYFSADDVALPLDQVHVGDGDDA